jgi:hypothetical protein
MVYLAMNTSNWNTDFGLLLSYMSKFMYGSSTNNMWWSNFFFSFILQDPRLLGNKQLALYTTGSYWTLDVHESLHRDTTIKLTNKMHYIDQFIIPSRLYMFLAMFSPIISSTWLYLQYLVVFTQVAAGWCRQQLGWTLPDTVNTVKFSWWWAETSPETCRSDLE